MALVIAAHQSDKLVAVSATFGNVTEREALTKPPCPFTNAAIASAAPAPRAPHLETSYHGAFSVSQDPSRVQKIAECPHRKIFRIFLVIVDATMKKLCERHWFIILWVM